jgi:hypothetical protein
MQALSRSAVASRATRVNVVAKTTGGKTVGGKTVGGKKTTSGGNPNLECECPGTTGENPFHRHRRRLADGRSGALPGGRGANRGWDSACAWPARGRE